MIENFYLLFPNPAHRVNGLSGLNLCNSLHLFYAFLLIDGVVIEYIYPAILYIGPGVLRG